jgi:hypothetical protein
VSKKDLMGDRWSVPVSRLADDENGDESTGAGYPAAGSPSVGYGPHSSEAAEGDREFARENPAARGKSS